MSNQNASDRDVTRAIRSWLHEDQHEDATRIAAAVMDRVEATQRRRARWWPARRTSTMSKFLGLAAAVAAVVVAAGLGIRLLGPTDTGPAAAPTPAPTSTPVATVAPTASPAPSVARVPGSGPIAAGTYVMGDPTSPIRLAIPSGWDAGFDGTDIRKHRDQPNEVGLEVYPADIHVYRDACDTQAAPPSMGPTVDDLVAALVAQQSSDTTAPAQISVDGHPGVRLVISPAKGLDQTRCTDGLVRIWSAAAGGNYLVVGTQPAAISVVGTSSGRVVLVPMGAAPAASAADLAELQAIVDSIQIEPAP